MSKLALTAIMAIVMFGGTSTAQAHLVTKPKSKAATHRLASQTENLKHAMYVCKQGKRQTRREHCNAISWLTNERQQTQWQITPPVDPDCWSDNPNVALGNRMAKVYGWHTGSEWCALYRLWNHESGWDERADNPTSDACGIPQRMDDCANAGYNPVAQITWGLSYIFGRYRKPSNAYYHLRTQNYY